MAFAPVKLILLFAWFLCGLYALKIGDEKLGKRHSSLKEYYNLLALFLGPLAIAYCYLRENTWEFLLALFRRPPFHAKEGPIEFLRQGVFISRFGSSQKQSRAADSCIPRASGRSHEPFPGKQFRK